MLPYNASDMIRKMRNEFGLDTSPNETAPAGTARASRTTRFVRWAGARIAHVIA